MLIAPFAPQPADADGRVFLCKNVVLEIVNLTARRPNLCFKKMGISSIKKMVQNYRNRFVIWQIRLHIFDLILVK